MFTRSGDQIEIATLRALRHANSSITDTKKIFINTSHSIDMRARQCSLCCPMVERNALLISFRWEKCARHCSCIPSYINITEIRLQHLGMFVPGPLWQSAATCRVPSRPSYRCSTLTVHLRSVACMQMASSHPATGVTVSGVQ